MWSVYDKQTGDFLESGKNSNTKQDAADGAFEFIISGEDFTKEEISKLQKDTIAAAELFEFEIREHNEPMGAE